MAQSNNCAHGVGCGVCADCTRPHNAVSAEPVPLRLPQFQWSQIDVDSDNDMQELHALLRDHSAQTSARQIVAQTSAHQIHTPQTSAQSTQSTPHQISTLQTSHSADSVFSFDYSHAFLRWALKPPGWRAQWHVGIRAGGRLVAFIAAVPGTVCVRGAEVKCVSVSFLCVHRRLRKCRLAPMLIREITRRVNAEGTWQAVYATGIALPGAVAACQWYHRPLHAHKLADVGFMDLPEQCMRAIAKPPAIRGMRRAEARDTPAIVRALAASAGRELRPVFGEREVTHWFLSGAVTCYVVEGVGARAMDADANTEDAAGAAGVGAAGAGTNTITDMFSYYTLPSSVSGNATHGAVTVAYSFYNVSTRVPLQTLMHHALVTARDSGHDVFNALDSGDNATVFEQLRFQRGCGLLYYYLYNWQCSAMEPSDVGLTLV